MKKCLVNLLFLSLKVSDGPTRPYTQQTFTVSKSTIETLETNSKSKIEILEQFMKSEHAFGKCYETLVNVLI